MIGIRREDKNDWERRAPLTPDHVAELVQEQGLTVCVQPSTNRAFADLDYTHAGAVVDDDLSDCTLVLGIKEIPVEALLRNKTYLFFSHTTKGQAYNMPLLRRLMELGCTLIDYEQIVDARGRRLIFFGRHAGYAGMIDALWALGRRLAAEGFRTPFERVRLAHDYSSLDEATHHISRIGERLRHMGVPQELRPIVCGFTGSGNVSQGAQEIFERLPTLDVLPEQLESLLADPDRPRKVLYKVEFGREHRFERVEPGAFDAAELAAHPVRYRNGMTRWLRFLTLLIHGAFWFPPQPRLLSLCELKRLWERDDKKLKVIADISCDIDGGIEATVRATTPGDPVFVYEPAGDRVVDGIEGDGPVILSVDNLPCQLPAESSEHFGDTLVGAMPLLARVAWDKPLDELSLPEELQRAVIVHRGRLTSRFDYLSRSLETT